MTQASNYAMDNPSSTVVNASSHADGSGTSNGVSATIKDLHVDTVDIPLANGTSDASSPSVKANGDDSPVQQRRDSLRRTSSKIANLRAAFEKNVDNQLNAIEVPKRRLKSSPAGNPDHEAEITKLKEKLEHEVELRQAYEDKCTSLEEGIDELQAKLDRKEAAWMADTETQSKDLLREKQKAIEEASNAQRQLAELKRSISTSTRVESQIVSDSTFVQEFDLLYHEVQNFVVNNYRRTKAVLTTENLVSNFEKASESIHAPAAARAVLANFDSAFKIPIFQAVTATYIIAIFQEPLLFGLSSDMDWYQTVCKAADALPMVLSAAAFNKWRAITLDVVRQSDHLKQSIELAAREMSESVCNAMDAITESEASETRIVSLTGIARRAISLAHMFRVQRAHYEFMLPDTDSPFDPSTMEDVSEDSHPTFASTVRCAMSPAIIKLGDADGDNVSKMVNVIVKAKVLSVE